MTIRILFFGKLADEARKQLGASELDMAKGEHDSIQDVIDALSQMSPDLGELIQQSGNLFACNQTICKVNARIAAGDEIAFMSPLSGG